MNLTLFFDHRFVRVAGRIHTRGAFDSGFWQRYLDVFDRLTVVSRVELAQSPPPGARPADHDRVDFLPLPPYVGPWSYLRHWLPIRRTVAQAVAQSHAILLRVPSTIGTLAWTLLRQKRTPTGNPPPFAVEVVADPRQTLAAGAAGGLLRPLAQQRYARALRAICREAHAAAYVSRQQLQRAYPPGAPQRAAFYSSIDLDPALILPHPRNFDRPAANVVFVGSLEMMYKGPDLLAHALALARRHDWQLTYVGDGRSRPRLETLVRRLGIAAQVRFTGQLPGFAAVVHELDRADLFVLPSRAEGVPKALIEAFARALPCIATRVGSLPELLDDQFLVPPDNPHALAARMHALMDNPAALRAASARNLAAARDYASDLLSQRRRAFYAAFRDAVAAVPDH